MAFTPSRLLTELAKVVLEWGDERTVVYVHNTVVEYTEDKRMQGYRGRSLLHMVTSLRNKSGKRILIHNVTGAPPEDLITLTRRGN